MSDLTRKVSGMNDIETPADVAAKVKYRVEAGGISQGRLAHEIGIRRQTVNRKLNGHALLDTRDLAIIAGLLGITVEALVSPIEGKGQAA